MAKRENRAEAIPGGGLADSARSAPSQAFEKRTLLQDLLSEKPLLTTVRDVVLTFLPTIYVLGYVTWSINALHLRLGLLPVIDQQYFIAGIFPFFVCFSVFLLFKVSRHYAELIDRSLPANIRLLQLIVRFVVSIVAGAFSISTILAPEMIIGSHRAENALFIEVSAIVLAALVCFIFPSRLDQSKGQPLRLHTLFLPIVIFLIGMYLAARSLSYVPNAVGGLQPRCAFLDLNADALAPQTLADLGLTASSPEKALRTPRAVWVIFMSGKYAVLKISEKDPYPVEIKADSILFITWQACKEH